MERAHHLHTNSRITPCRQLSGKKQYDCSPPINLLSRLAPADFTLLPKLKATLEGHHFETIEEIKKNMEAVSYTHLDVYKRQEYNSKIYKERRNQERRMKQECHMKQ